MTCPVARMKLHGSCTNRCPDEVSEWLKRGGMLATYDSALY